MYAEAAVILPFSGRNKKVNTCIRIGLVDVCMYCKTL
jgi:hypothetical protein